jgi:carbon-monoxide dehydrogenase small subunit
MVEIVRCIVNGKPVEVAVDPRESLTDMLRHKLGLTSVKKGCEVGECGACTVLVDGKAITSCVQLAVWAEGKTIITVEGLQAKDGAINHVQQAFVDAAATQCGFCTPGFIMTAMEIISHNKRYTREEIRLLISGNICRCTGYEQIIDAIENAIDQHMA